MGIGASGSAIASSSSVHCATAVARSTAGLAMPMALPNAIGSPVTSAAWAALFRRMGSTARGGSEIVTSVASAKAA